MSSQSCNESLERLSGGGCLHEFLCLLMNPRTWFQEQNRPFSVFSLGTDLTIHPFSFVLAVDSAVISWFGSWTGIVVEHVAVSITLTWMHDTTTWWAFKTQLCNPSIPHPVSGMQIPEASKDPSRNLASVWRIPPQVFKFWLWQIEGHRWYSYRNGRPGMGMVISWHVRNRMVGWSNLWGPFILALQGGLQLQKFRSLHCIDMWFTDLWFEYV